MLQILYFPLGQVCRQARGIIFQVYLTCGANSSTIRMLDMRSVLGSRLFTKKKVG